MVLIGNMAWVERFDIRNHVIPVHKNITISADDDQKLIGIAFKNVGQSNCTINGAVLDVGDPMLSYGGEKGVYDNTRYEILFQDGNNPYVEVHQVFEEKAYVITIPVKTIESV